MEEMVESFHHVNHEISDMPDPGGHYDVSHCQTCPRGQCLERMMWRGVTGTLAMPHIRNNLERSEGGDTYYLFESGWAKDLLGNFERTGISSSGGGWMGWMGYSLFVMSCRDDLILQSISVDNGVDPRH
jgi:hypothetical protein